MSISPKTDWLARVAELEPVAVSQSAAEVIREAREDRDEQCLARQRPTP